ncbi:protein of unknown function [Methylocella tundrae]|uniref:Tc1-like transposase DDE domain-containing protein n=1 Tax=Methylocella tundrae TaxID=227605 RepID=A0A4U8Z4X5_METTU|nr:protein of unknown function [Methylocella tundrae]
MLIPSSNVAQFSKCQLDLDPERLIFIDETWASTNMARLRGRALKGERLRAAIPHGHWKTTTFVAGCGFPAWRRRWSSTGRSTAMPSWPMSIRSSFQNSTWATS